MWSLTLPRGRSLNLGTQPVVMGVLNLTPDSFSDGGQWRDAERAVERGLRMLDQGAGLIDLGAESTRPGGGVYGDGARTISTAEELDRLMPVLQRLRLATEAPISIDTRKGEVARQALAAGADLINDVGGLRDRDLVAAVVAAGCPVIIMHSRGKLASMQRGIAFREVVEEVYDELQETLTSTVRAGLAMEQAILDPGIGFGKTAANNLALLRGNERLKELGRPILIGASRKSFIAEVSTSGPAERLGGSLAAVAWAAQLGVSVVRVHDVFETMQFLKVWNAINLAGKVTAS